MSSFVNIHCMLISTENIQKNKRRNNRKKCYKGTVSRDLLNSSIFHEASFPKPKIILIMPFQFFSRVANLPPLSLTPVASWPVANLPSVSMTPAVNLQPVSTKQHVCSKIKYKQKFQGAQHQGFHVIIWSG